MAPDRKECWSDWLTGWAYQYQQVAEPYQELLDDTIGMIQIKPESHLVDIGCGSGALLDRTLHYFGDSITSFTAADCNVFALDRAKKLVESKYPNHAGGGRYETVDISHGFNLEKENSVDLAISGLALQYAEHFDGEKWTRQAYQNLLSDIWKTLKPGGQLVYSVNVPSPDSKLIAKRSLKAIFLSWKVLVNIAAAIIMLRQTKPVREWAEKGRFHFLPIEEILPMLETAGFINLEYKLSYAGQAYVISAFKSE